MADSIINEGSITASNGYGIYTSSSDVSTGIRNDGEITAAYGGIYVDSFMGYAEGLPVGAVINDENGVITVTDGGTGITLEDLPTTSMINAGVINASTGMYLESSYLESDILNSGTMNASYEGVSAEDSYVEGMIANSGTITVTEEGPYYGRGISVTDGTGVGAGILNTGDITAGYGILVEDGMIEAAILNDGALEAGIANSGTINSRHIGIYIDELSTSFDGESSQKAAIYNEGAINGDYQGIHINGELNGDILNTGTISSDQGAAIYASFGADHDGSVENYGSITGGNDGETVTAIDYGDAFAPLTLVQKAGQIIGSIFGSSEDSSDRAYIDGGSITGDLHDIEGIYVDGVTTLDGNVYGGTFINIESSGNLTLTGEARSFESDLNLHGGTLSLNISNETDPAEAMLSTKGDIYLSSNSRLIITASQNLEVNLDPVDYLALSGNALSHSGVTVESGSAIITAELAEITVNSLSVTVATNDFGQVIESVGATGNEVQVIDAYMQEYIASSGGECNAICQAIEQAETAEELAAIAEEMVPDSSGVVGASQAAQSETLGAVFKRIAGFRSSVSGVSSGDNIEPGSLWMQALASDGDQDAVQYQGNDFDGYSYRTRGFTIGADADLSDTLTAGLAVTYGVTKSDVEGSANRSETDSYLLTAYGSWRQQDYFMDSSIAFGVSRSDIEQYTANVKSSADSDAAQVALRLVTGRTFAFNDNDTIVEPQVAFNYSRVDTDSYTLQPLNMEVLDQRIETVELGAGLRAMTAIDTKRGLLIPEVNLMAWHDFAADRGDTAARFLNGAGNSFVTTGAKPEQTNYQAGLGVQYWLNNNVSLSANYDRNWNSSFSADTWLANIRYDF